MGDEILSINTFLIIFLMILNIFSLKTIFFIKNELKNKKRFNQKFKKTNKKKNNNLQKKEFKVNSNLIEKKTSS